MFPFLYLQVKYKEAIGQGTPIPDLPEVKRVKETQKHISSVMARVLSMHLCNQPPPNSPLALCHPSFPGLGNGVNLPPP